MVPPSVDKEFHFSLLNSAYSKVNQVSKPVHSLKWAFDAAG